MNLFKKKKELIAFTSGVLVKLEDVDDPMFSQGLMGKGIAIDSSDGKFYSPVDGEITMLFPTLHALGIKAVSGEEILIHIGVDTVSLKGEGFKSYVSTGDKISKGDLLIEADLAFIKSKNLSSVGILCISEPKDINIEFTNESQVIAKKDSLALIK